MSIVDWPPEATAYIRKWYGRKSASVIANEMPGTRRFTRSAIVGKAMRMGLRSDLVNGSSAGSNVQHGTPSLQVKRTSNPLDGRLALARSSVNEKAGGMGQYKQVTLAEPTVLDLPNLWCKGITLYELTEDTCRWPVDGTRLFCGLLPWKNNPYGGSPYCAAHHRLGHKPVAEHTRLARRR